LSPATWCLVLLTLSLAVSVLAAEDTINPYPRELIRTEKLQEWTFKEGTAGWAPVHDATATAEGGVFKIQCMGGDPYVFSPAVKIEGPVVVNLRAKCKTGGDGQFFWATAPSPNFQQRQSAHFKLTHDGQWHDYAAPLPVQGTLTRLRLDPGSAPGLFEIERIELQRATLHPIELVKVEAIGCDVALYLKNHSTEAMDLAANGQAVAVAGGKTERLVLKSEAKTPFEAFGIDVQPKGLPAIRRTLFLHHPEAQTDWVALPDPKGITIRLAKDGSGVQIGLGGQLAAIVAPLVHCEGVAPKLVFEGMVIGDAPLCTILAANFRGQGISVSVSRRTDRPDELVFTIESEKPCEGPVLRALGPLENGLFAGLEYLSAGEHSSSTADLETAEHIRYVPDPLKVTMPLMACVVSSLSLRERGGVRDAGAGAAPPAAGVTSSGPHPNPLPEGEGKGEDRLKAGLQTAVAMTWNDMSLQPVYAVPNFFDGTPDHRMALRGTKIEATLLVRKATIEDTILWAVKAHGLPPLPQPPRSPEAQRKLALSALNGPLKDEGGWGHCAEPNWKRQPFADHASTIWRLTGEAPDLPRLVPGGAHVPNDAIYFVTGRAKEWLDMRRGQAKGTIASQKPDGSFHYQGQYRKGHFEDTASGHCARPAATLLEFAWQTGDKAALDAGLKALDYMKRFTVPRGAQTWELSLHTPDILASAHLVHAYVRGFQLTGKQDYLAEARRWALSGVPFVYLWSRHPTMMYATVPVYGATSWRAPNWMGLPVQWCGGVYAYALTLLAPHDQTLDWRQFARGILISGEQQEYPDGQYAGTLPDSFVLDAQRRQGPNINPCAFLSLRWVLDGEPDSLAVAADGKHRVVAPFPVELRDGKAHLRAKAGLSYQVLLDGQKIIDVTSEGTDIVPLP